MPTLLLVIFVAGLPVLTLGFWTFDQLLRHQRNSYPDAWVSDGRPCPFFFRGGLAWPATFRAQLASRWLSITWFVRTPEWIEGDSSARRLLHRYRVLGALWNLGVMPLFVVTLIIAARADQQASHATPHSIGTLGIPSAH